MKLKKIHKQRLLKLARFLRNQVAKREDKFEITLYDHGNWMRADKNGHDHKKASLKCGTPACAIGWATAIFPLYMNKRDQIVKTGSRGGSTIKTVKSFFGVDYSEFEGGRLFFSGDYRTAEREANMIEDYVQTR